MENIAMEIAQTILVNFAILFTVGAFAGRLADYLRVPDIVIYMITGIIFGASGLQIISIPTSSALNQVIFILGASTLLFHGGLGVRFAVLKEVWVTIALLATLAVIIMVVVVGGAAYVFLGVGLLHAMLLGAILAPTDPAVLVPIFLSVKVKERLAQTILGESACNDATGAIVASTILGVIVTGRYSVTTAFGQFLLMAVGGLLIGLFLGIAAGFLISEKSQDIFSEHAQVLMLPLIITAYMTAEYFKTSGFMAVFAAGVVLGNLEQIGWAVKEDCQKEVHSFIHISSLLLRIAIFVILGANVNVTLLLRYLFPGMAIGFVFMFIARPLAVFCSVMPDVKANWRKNEMFFMFWTRETGVIPAALAGMVGGMGVPNAEIISSVTFLMIILTISLQATTTPWIAKKLNVLDSEESRLDKHLYR